MGTRFFQKTLDNIADRSRHLLDWNGRKGSTKHTETIENLSHALLSGRGEASGVALARQVLDVYAGLAMAERIEFFRLLAATSAPTCKVYAPPGATTTRRRPRKTWYSCFTPLSRHVRSCSAG